MKREYWEYETALIQKDRLMLKETLDIYGKNSWEVMGFESEGNFVRVIMKRRIEGQQ